MKDTPLNDINEKVEKESGGITNLLEKIPGFKGYIAKEQRREADQLLRKTIADRLDATRVDLASVHQTLSQDILKAIEHAEPLGRADSSLMGIIGKINDAPSGYAGFFDAVKIEEDDLARVYEFDDGMMGHSDDIAGAVANLKEAAGANGDIAGAIAALHQSTQDAHATFAKRDEVMKGLGEDTIESSIDSLKE